MGAAAGISAAATAASKDELVEVLKGLPEEQRKRLAAALSAEKPSEGAEAAAPAATAAKKILMVLTSNDKLGESGEQTGWYLPEAAHPYAVFKGAGLAMTWASPKGGLAPVDAGSIDASKDDTVSMQFHNEDGKTCVSETIALKDAKVEDYDAVFFVGGFGTMWDFPDDPDVQRIASGIWGKGGVVSAVCHGPCALVNVKLEDGSLLVKDKEVTAFTNAEEDAVKRRSIVPFTCEDKLGEIGAKFSDGGVFKANVKIDGKLITGQNPPSAEPCAKAVVAALAA
jgi:putative intracellular protease/amidase